VSPPAPDPQDLLEVALHAGAEAAGLLMAERHAVRAGLATKSSLTDMVSDVDRAAERLLVDTILRARPDDGVLGEEGAAREGSTGVRWVLDPLDGTTNYLYGLPSFGVSVAAEVDGAVTAGVVVDPTHGDTFAATRGGGATCNGAPIRTGAARDLDLALVGTGFAYDAARRRRQAAVLVPVLPAVRDIRRAGAAAIDLCWVACGRLDGYYERGLQPWDLAAGALVATEAGARTGDLAGGPPSGAFALAAAPGIFDDLRALLRAAGAAEA
jgi:myo-inositol-1(or 4)-monophosphatase